MPTKLNVISVSWGEEGAMRAMAAVVSGIYQTAVVVLQGVRAVGLLIAKFRNTLFQ